MISFRAKVILISWSGSVRRCLQKSYMIWAEQRVRDHYHRLHRVLPIPTIPGHLARVQIPTCPAAPPSNMKGNHSRPSHGASPSPLIASPCLLEPENHFPKRHRHNTFPDEEERVNRNGRSKYPFDAVIDYTKQASRTATFYLRPRSQEPEHSVEYPTNGKNSSYDYSAEEREFQAAQSQSHPRRSNHPGHRRNRMSTDNKAHKPTASDLDATDDDYSGDERAGRRRKKKDPVGGPLTSLPMFGPEKKKRRPRRSKGNADEMDYESDDEHVSDQVCLT